MPAFAPRLLDAMWIGNSTMTHRRGESITSEWLVSGGPRGRTEVTRTRSEEANDEDQGPRRAAKVIPLSHRGQRVVARMMLRRGRTGK